MRRLAADSGTLSTIRCNAAIMCAEQRATITQSRLTAKDSTLDRHTAALIGH
jgi:hypothetical protein